MNVCATISSVNDTFNEGRWLLMAEDERHQKGKTGMKSTYKEKKSDYFSTEIDFWRKKKVERLHVDINETI